MGRSTRRTGSVRKNWLSLFFSSLQHALRGRDAGRPRVAGGGRPQRAGDGLELGLDDVVGVAAVEDVDVQADAGRVRQRLPDVPGEGGVVAADHRGHPGRLVVHHVGAPGQVDGGADQGLVERDERVAEPGDSGFVAKRLAQRLAERDRGVLNGVVRVDLGVALGADGQAEAAVLAELVEHVVEERDPGLDLDRAGAVEVELDQQLRLLGLAHPPAHPAAGGELLVAAHWPSTSVSASRNALISCGVPTVTRSHPAGPVSLISTHPSGRLCQILCRSSKVPNRTKLASLSAALRPLPRSHVTRASRSDLSASTLDSSSPVCASAVRATAWVTVDRWYGSRTRSSASGTAGSSAR